MASMAGLKAGAKAVTEITRSLSEIPMSHQPGVESETGRASHDSHFIENSPGWRPGLAGPGESPQPDSLDTK